jgi:hypothetical protein
MSGCGILPYVTQRGMKVLIIYIKNDIQAQISYLKCICNTKRVNFVTETKLLSCRCSTVPAVRHSAPAENEV